MAEKASYLQDQDVLDFNKKIKELHLGPLWNAIPELMHRQPTPQAVAYLWKWSKLHEIMMEAREIFTPERGGERRAIYFQNPGLTYRQPWGWASTTQTLYAAVQMILPGETAPSHRHSQSALRFIIQGSGAFTTVQGQRIFMNEGDFLVTPAGLWHGHAHPGTGPMLWMDALDIPTMYAIGGTFFEPYADGLEPPSVPDDYSTQRYMGGIVRPLSDRKPQVAPVGKYREGTEQAIAGLSRFDPDPYDGYAVEYFNPSTGGTATPNIMSVMQKLPKGFKGKAHRHTSSLIYQVYKGSGYTVINGVRFNWSQGDFFVVPNWAWHEHAAEEDSCLFSVSDQPIMEKFNVQREEAYESNNGHQDITEEFKPSI